MNFTPNLDQDNLDTLTTGLDQWAKRGLKGGIADVMRIGAVLHKLQGAVNEAQHLGGPTVEGGADGTTTS